MGDPIDEKTLKKITDFIQKYNPHFFDREKIKEYVLKHLEYKTAFVMLDDGEVVAVCRWNLQENDTKAKILDFMIREDYREKWGNHIFKQFLQRGLWIFPKVMYVGWERAGKPNDRGMRYYNVNQILKRS
jgi:hypothetical protein